MQSAMMDVMMYVGKNHFYFVSKIVNANVDKMFRKDIILPHDE